MGRGLPRHGAAARGRRRGSTDGLARIVASARVILAVVASAASGTEVLVGVRPEDVMLFEPDAELPLTVGAQPLAAT